MYMVGGVCSKKFEFHMNTSEDVILSMNENSTIYICKSPTL